jgi:hypothetical protein
MNPTMPKAAAIFFSINAMIHVHQAGVVSLIFASSKKMIAE